VALCEHCRAELEGPGERLPPLWFDYDQRTVAGAPLTPMAWRVLEILWHRRGHAVSSDSLMTLLYTDKPDDPPDEKIIDVYICRLRAALDPTPYSIKTYWAVGYRFLLHKELAEPVVGEVEDNEPAPLREVARPKRDKYGLAGLQPGQSRRIDNAKLATLKAACAFAKKRGYGRFTAGPDSAGHLRIWRMA
jgi:DNA-binding winged helix-turn-helix (wHTH) protein